MVEHTYRQRWDLDSLFQGGSISVELTEHLSKLEFKTNSLMDKVDCLHSGKDSIRILELLEEMNLIRVHLSQASSFMICLLAQSQKDEVAKSLQGRVELISVMFDSIVQKVQRNLVQINENSWEEILEHHLLRNYRFLLNEWREKGKQQLSEGEAEVLSTLMNDGFHSWGQLYKELISDINVPVSMYGEVKHLSVGQTINLRSHPDEEIRKNAHLALEDILTEHEEKFAQIYNHITGFRLQVYKRKKFDNVLKESLINNRIEEQTLNAMWNAIAKQKASFSKYLYKKAEMLGEKKLSAYNFWAPISGSKQKIGYKDAVDFIIEHFSQFGPRLEQFTLKAFKDGWVESEDRLHKSPAGFCAGFPLSGESRVFMTYGGRITSVLTLAHELGHAFHNFAMKPVAGLNKQYPLCIAETASTFAEMIVLDGAIAHTSSQEEKLFLLDEKLKRSVMNFMNIHSRFIFEKNFYQEREVGFVSSIRLNQLMEEALEESYLGSLQNVSSHSWVWTPHFYLTRTPFYNFPYTFGYLFSLSLFARAKHEGTDFEKKYLALLSESGSMSVEELVMKHLGEDIRNEKFWEYGLNVCLQDVEEFIRLTEKMS